MMRAMLGWSKVARISHSRSNLSCWPPKKAEAITLMAKRRGLYRPLAPVRLTTNCWKAMTFSFSFDFFQKQVTLDRDLPAPSNENEERLAGQVAHPIHTPSSRQRSRAVTMEGDVRLDERSPP